MLIAVFLAFVVEAVEAVTIVLAAGTARDWRSASSGTMAALVVLRVVVEPLLGPAVSHIRLTGLRIMIRALLLMLGLQWIPKPSCGQAALRHFTRIQAVLAERLAEASSQQKHRYSSRRTWCRYTLAFGRACCLRGLEVIFIVLSLERERR